MTCIKQEQNFSSPFLPEKFLSRFQSLTRAREKKKDDYDSEILLQWSASFHFGQSRPPHWDCKLLLFLVDFFFFWNFTVNWDWEWNICSSICRSIWPIWRDGPTIFKSPKPPEIESWVTVSTHLHFFDIAFGFCKVFRVFMRCWEI